MRILLILLYMFVLLVPAVVFFSARGGIQFLDGVDFQTATLLLFPLLGLYAFTFTWLQIIVGSSSAVYKKLWPNYFTFHRGQGLVALLFALLHPLFLILGYGFSAYRSYAFVDPSLKVFAFFGQMQVLILLLTIAAALLMKQPWMRPLWKKIHYANYAVFTLAWFHGWFLGSDVQSYLSWFWYFTALTAITSVVFRIARTRKPASTLAAQQQPIPPSPIP